VAVLPTLDRLRVAGQWMRDASASQEPCAFTKDDLRAAVAAADDWVESNTVAFNAALPQPFRSAGTPTQKIAILAYVLWRRAGRLRAPEDG
jgi:hypothetical protein